MNRKFLTGLLLVLLSATSNAQDSLMVVREGLITARYLNTINEGELQDFNIGVLWGKYHYERQLSSWFSLGATGMGIVHAGLNGVNGLDAQTGSGPIYEANLWLGRNIGRDPIARLPEIYAKLDFDKHHFKFGRFGINSPWINPEVWPIQNSIQGVWYKGDFGKNITLDLGYVNRIASRFSGNFRNIGATLGEGGLGVGLDGNRSGYTGQTDSDYMYIGSVNFKKNNFHLSLWDYYTDNVSNTLVAEGVFQLNGTNGLTLSTQMIYQSRVRDGGNANDSFRYFTNENANAFGLRLRKVSGMNILTLNFTRIGDQGRMLMPREWGKEPFYTFQRRTRVEGMQNVTAIMASYQRTTRRVRIITSLGYHDMPNPSNQPEKNKYVVPSSLNLDLSIKYYLEQVSPDLSLELFMLHRFLTEGGNLQPQYLINRSNFSQVDLIIAYKF